MNYNSINIISLQFNKYELQFLNHKYYKKLQPILELQICVIPVQTWCNPGGPATEENHVRDLKYRFTRFMDF